MPFHPRDRHLVAALLATLLLGSAAGAPALSSAEAAPSPGSGAHDYRDRNFDYFVVGNPASRRAAHTQARVALMGGGGRLDEAFRFIALGAGGGHIVILGAVGDDSFDATDGGYDVSFAGRWGPVTSAETIIFHNRQAAFDPRVAAALAGADGIFIRGGDQAQYIHYWKGTPVQAALNDHLRAGRPIGGSSAGLAILGHYSYTALDGGSMESKVALADPFNAGMTLESDFLHDRWLGHVATDTHFSRRARLGRLIAFLARFNADHPAGKIFGLGVDEKTALLIGPDGVGRLAAGSAGSAWLVVPRRPAKVLTKGQALSIDDVELTRLDQPSDIDLATRAVHRAGARAKISIAGGKLTGESIASPILMRAAAPPNED